MLRSLVGSEMCIRDSFPLEHCSDVVFRGSSCYKVKCLLCGWTGTATLHKLLYGHFLSQKGMDIKDCIKPDRISALHPEFWTKLEDRLTAYKKKRRIKFDKQQDVTKRRAGVEGSASERDSGKTTDDHVIPSSNMNTASSRSCSGSIQLPLQWTMLSKDVRAARWEEAQKAWDLFFFVHGLSHSLTDSPLLRAAIACTHAVPPYTPLIHRAVERL
eukprot:TRINITY_DN8047_c0_g2_i3.p1 TRINITY_DN8047_c0_g2~~TRINITY_DN8047_c0_g2_i3.p1  ORF type:complete len:230 (+),score=51.02 TRINITY_DN8047_c0_g2_i3:46-690(+)